MLDNSHHRPAFHASRRSAGVLVCFFLALLILLILSPRARAEHSAADTVAGLAASATHAVATATHDVPAAPGAPTAAPSVVPAPPAGAPAPGSRPIAVAAPVPTPGGVAGTVHTTLDRTTADASAATGHVVALAHVSTGPINEATGLANRVTSTVGDAPRIVAGGAATVVHTVGRASTEAPAGVLIRELARSTGVVRGTVEHLAPKPTPSAHVTLPGLPSPIPAPPHARSVLQAGELAQLRRHLAPTAPGQPAATALPTFPPMTGLVPSAALSRREIASSPGGASAASKALATIFTTAVQPSSYALLTGHGTAPDRPGPGGNVSSSAPPPAHPEPSAPPGGLAPGAAGGGGGLSTSIFLALAGLLMLAAPRALRRLGFVVEPSLQAPFALISARPG